MLMGIFFNQATLEGCRSANNRSLSFSYNVFNQTADSFCFDKCILAAVDLRNRETCNWKHLVVVLNLLNFIFKLFLKNLHSFVSLGFFSNYRKDLILKFWFSFINLFFMVVFLFQNLFFPVITCDSVFCFWKMIKESKLKKKKLEIGCYNSQQKRQMCCNFTLQI